MTEADNFLEAVSSIYHEHGYEEALKFLVFKGCEIEAADMYLRENNLHVMHESVISDAVLPAGEENVEEPQEPRKSIFDRLFGGK